jgi:hypothetical protein
LKQEKLQVVLLVKALEEADKKGEVIPFADRDRATSAALRANGLPVEGPVPDVAAEKLSQTIYDRAESLLKGVITRYPVVDDLLTLGSWRKWVAGAVLAGAALSGFAMSAIPDRINILDWTYLGLIVWNVAVYVLIALGGLLPLSVEGPGISRLLRVGARWVEGRLTRVLARTSLSEMLIDVSQRFFEDWRKAASAVAAQRVRLLLHVAAAFVAGGVIVGLYAHAFDERHVVHWESDLLQAPQVKQYIDLLFSGPASLLNIPLPNSIQDYVEMDGGVHGNASNQVTPWLNLFSVVLLVTVIVPRLGLAGIAWFKSGWLQRKSHLPDSMIDYSRATLGVAASTPRATFLVFPYEYRPASEIQARVDAHIRRHFGRGTQSQVQPVIDAGEEHQIESATRPPANAAGGWLVLVSLAVRPSSKAYGVMIKAIRESASSIQGGMLLQLLVDESTYVRRFIPSSLRLRLAERRRRQWRRFASAHRIDISFLPVV